MNAKYLILSLIFIPYVYGNAYEIPSEVLKLHHRIENIEKITLCNNILPYGMVAIGGALVCISDYKMQALMYSVASYIGLTGFLTVYSVIQKLRARYYFRQFASKRVGPNGTLIESHLAPHFPYALTDNQFVVLGLKCGFSELELIDLAKRFGRLEVAYQLKQFSL